MREMIPEMFGSIKTELIALFNEWYAAFASTIAIAATSIVAAAASPVKKEMPYREFNNTMPRDFNGVRDPIVAMRWNSDLEG